MRSTDRRRARAWTALVAVALVACSHTSPAQDPAPAKSPEEAMSDALGLKPDDYWNAPEVGMPAFRALREKDHQGVTLGAPPTIPLDARETAPLLVYRTGSYRDCAALDLDAHGLVTIMDLDRNDLLLSRARSSDSAEAMGPRGGGAPPDPATLPEGFTATQVLLDMHADCRLPRRPGEYLVAVLLRDRVSNRLTVRLERSAGAYQDPEVERLVRAERRKTQARPVAPAPVAGAPFPSYVADEATPAVPEQVGLALVAERAVVLREGASCVLRGAFRATALPEEVVKPGEHPGSPAQDDPATGKRRPTAVVRVHLAVVGSDVAEPTVLRLDVPSYDPIDAGADAPVVTGRFALDLLSLRSMPKRAQTYFIYGFVGPAMVGPTPVALVSPDALPPR